VTQRILETIRIYLAERTPRREDDAGAIQAAVAIVLCAGRAHSPEVLLIKRAEREGDPWSGQMALPGGRRDTGDRDLLRTACRETWEETGVELTAGPLLGQLDDLRPRTKVLPPIVVRPFVFGLAEQPAVETNDEVTLHIWVPLRELRAAATRSQVEVRGHVLDVPAYVLGAHVVWGMTERILKPIIDLY
jgi:8-oxo-dGTP pyrophosphatase MutT (NUDIX family)